MAEPLPFVASNVDVELGGDSVKCLLNHIELAPDVSIETSTTMCGVTDWPGAVKWTLSLTLYQSFDVGGTDELLQAIVEAGVPVPFVITPNSSRPVSVTNPTYSGEVIPQPYPILSADAGALSTCDIAWSVVGTPVRSTTPAAPPLADDAEPAVTVAA